MVNIYIYQFKPNPCDFWHHYAALFAAPLKLRTIQTALVALKIHYSSTEIVCSISS